MYVVTEKCDFLVDRHFDQLLLCALYSACKINANPIKFRQILLEYKKKNADKFNTVIYYSERGDIIKLYNNEFVSIISCAMERFKKEDQPAEIVFSPDFLQSPLIKNVVYKEPDLKSRKVLKYNLENI